jgi:lipoate-protein ligase A
MSSLPWDQTWTNVMPATWRLVRSAPASGVRNMAIDSALLDAAITQQTGVWRTYTWLNPTISFGRNEAVLNRFSAESVARAGLDVVRRPTGGRALLHAAEVTYCVAVPVADAVSWSTVYAAVNGVLLAALQILGVPAQLAADTDAPLVKPDGPVCFDQPAPGEIAVQGQKLVGSAVWRERGAYLQHGSILIEDQQARLATAMHTPQPSAPAAASLSQLLTPTPAWSTVADALEQALRDATSRVGLEPPIATPLELSDHVLARHELRFRDPIWLWRR